MIPDSSALSRVYPSHSVHLKLISFLPFKRLVIDERECWERDCLRTNNHADHKSSREYLIDKLGWLNML